MAKPNFWSHISQTELGIGMGIGGIVPDMDIPIRQYTFDWGHHTKLGRFPKIFSKKNVRAPSITEHTSIYGNIPSMVPHRAHWEEFIWGSLAIDTDREKKVVRPPRYLL